jgi:hypothetical protein
VLPLTKGLYNLRQKVQARAQQAVKDAEAGQAADLLVFHDVQKEVCSMIKFDKYPG